MTQSTTQQTTTGLRVDDTVTYREFGKVEQFVVLAIVDNGLRVRLGDHNGDIGYPVNAYQCQLAERTASRTEPSADFPNVGSELRWTSPDNRTTITVRRGDLTWTIETYQGTLRIEEKCSSFATEREARGAARMYAEMAAADAERSADQTSRIAPTTPVRHQTRMSHQQATAILAAGPGGVIHRGRGKGQLTVVQLKALHNRGYGTAYVGDDGQINQLVVTAAGNARARAVTRMGLTAGTTTAVVMPLTARNTSSNQTSKAA